MSISKMTSKIFGKKSKEDAPKDTRYKNYKTEALPDVAFAAIVSSTNKKEVHDYVNYILEALERNGTWVNDVVGQMPKFQCLLMTGAGPNRFEIQEVIYPVKEDEELKLEVELRDTEDYNKIAFAALVKMTHPKLTYVLDLLKYRLHEYPMLKEDLMKGKAMGVSFAVLKPISDKVYRVMDRIILGSVADVLLKEKKPKSLKRPKRPSKLAD